MHASERLATFARPDGLTPAWAALSASDCEALAAHHYGTERGRKAALYARAKHARLVGRDVTALLFERQADALFW